MANNCSLKFNETKVGTNLRAEVGNDDVLFNSSMSAVIDGSRPSGFNKEFETYYVNNYGSIPNANTNDDNESKEVATAIRNFYKNGNFNVNEHTTNSAFISDVKSKGYTSTAAKTCGIRMAGNQMLMFYHDDLIKGRLDEHANDRKNNLADRVINRMLSGVAVGVLINRKTKPTPAEIDKIRKQLMNVDGNDFIKLEDEVSKATPQLRNQFATLKDMLSDKVKYFTQVIQTDQRLGEIRFKKDDDLSQQEADWNESYSIEDDEVLRGQLSQLLRDKGYEVIESADISGFNKIDRENTDLYLLDVYLPDGDGFSVCEKLRSEGCVTPVIFLTSCDDEDSITKGLDIGGDDYITKPFRVSELLSRISANLRRQAMLDKSISNIDKSNSNIYTLGSLVINFDNLTIKKAAKDIQLSPTEFALLEILVCNRGLIVRREVFFQKLWDRTGTFVEDNTLTVTVSRLKTKLGKMDNSDKNYIVTIRGVGY